MWISKKKYESNLREIKNQAILQSFKDEEETQQWQDINKLKKDVKKLKKIIKEGY